MAKTKSAKPKRKTNAELEEQIFAQLDGDDREAHVVYADWLTERGDPRGELVAVQLALEASPKNAKLRAREKALLRANAAEWLGAFAKADVSWRRGFLDSVSFENKAGASIRTLAKLAGTQFIRRVESADAAGTAFDAIATQGLPRATRTLCVVNQDGALNNVDRSYRRLATLRELSLEADWFHLGQIALPALRSLELITRGFRSINLESIVEAEWPVLERLSLWIGDPDINDVETSWSDFEDLLSGKSLPAVRELGLCGRNAADVLEHVIDAPILAQLRVLDVSHYYLEASGVTWLSKHAAAFAHLDELRLPKTAGLAAISGVNIRVVSRP